MTSTARCSFVALSIGWLAGGCGDVRTPGTVGDDDDGAMTDGDSGDDGDQTDGSEPAPFTVAATAERLFLRQGETADLEVTVQRDDGFDDPITVDLDRLPSGVSAEPLALAGGATSGTMTVSAAADSTQGALQIDVTGRAGELASSADLHLVVAGPPGTLDQSFGDGGVLIYQPDGVTSFGRGIAVQPDGKLLVTGATLGTVLTLRVDPDGALDDTFGDGGAALHGNGTSSSGTVVATSGADRILVGGTDNPADTSDMAVFAYTATGERDRDFGVGGVAVAGTGAPSGIVSRILVEPDDSFLAVGTGTSNEGADQDTLHVFRYSPTGALDPSLAIAQVGLRPSSAIIDRAGRLLVVGDTFVGDQFDYFIARYLPDGTADQTFGTGGLTVVDFAVSAVPSADTALAVVEEPDGKLLVAGSVLSNGRESTGLARLLPDGTLDSSFGSNGKSIPPTLLHGFGAAFDSTGRAVVSGVIPPPAENEPSQLAVARFLPDSTPDASFGDAGLAILSLPAGSVVGPAADLRSATFDADDRLITVGTAGPLGDLTLIVSRLWP